MNIEEIREQQYENKHYHHKKKRRNRALEATLIVLACVLVLALMAFGTYLIIQYMGAKNLETNATTEAPDMILTVPEEISEETEEKKEVTLDQSLKPGEVLYKGQKYAYNTDISFLIPLYKTFFKF